MNEWKMNNEVKNLWNIKIGDIWNKGLKICGILI